MPPGDSFGNMLLTKAVDMPSGDESDKLHPDATPFPSSQHFPPLPSPVDVEFGAHSARERFIRSMKITIRSSALAGIRKPSRRAFPVA